MTDNEKYLMHCSGIYSLMGWLREIQLSGAPCIHQEDNIILNPIISRRFGIGFAKGKHTSNSAFIAIQSNEHKWMKLIKWEKLYIRKNDNHLYFMSKNMPGDKEMYPDIPSFIFIIPIDHREKMVLFDDITKIEARELTFTEDGEMKINFSSRLFNITIKHLEEEEEIPQTEKSLFSRQDVILKKEAFAMSTEGSFKFIGDENEANSSWKNYQKQLDEIKKQWLK